MKKLGHILAGLIPIIIGSITIAASIKLAIDGDVFWVWLSSGLFGISLFAGGIAIITGVSLRDVFADFF
jgi:hypothetical protein